MAAISVGTVIRFVYHGKQRQVKVEKIENNFTKIHGWDYTADYPTGGHRTFHVGKMAFIELV
jgi:hypothetical protein